MGKVILLKIWRWFPGWLQNIAARVIRPLFQVFAVAVVFNEKKQLLLVKLTYQRFHPWGIPGGGIEYGEQPEDAVVREMLEETGITVAIKRFLLAKTWTPARVGLYYLCTIRRGDFQPSDEVSEIGYFSKDNLPDVRPLDVGLIHKLFDMVNDNELA